MLSLGLTGRSCPRCPSGRFPEDTMCLRIDRATKKNAAARDLLSGVFSACKCVGCATAGIDASEPSANVKGVTRLRKAGL